LACAQPLGTAAQRAARHTSSPHRTALRAAQGRLSVLQSPLPRARTQCSRAVPRRHRHERQTMDDTRKSSLRSASPRLLAVPNDDQPHKPITSRRPPTAVSVNSAKPSRKRASSNPRRDESRPKECPSHGPVITGSSAFADDDSRGGDGEPAERVARTYIE